MSFKEFARALSDTRIEFEHLKVAQLAQAILESGRGSSDLFKDHNNPFGMKYRPEMSGLPPRCNIPTTPGRPTPIVTSPTI